MGLFSSGDGKIDLARLLLIERLKSDPSAQAQGFTPFMVRQLPDSQVVGIVESSIIAIVETYTKLCLSGATESGALLKIEIHRRSLGFSELPSPLNLLSYIDYRVGIEYDGSALPRGHVSLCTQAADHFLAYRDDKGEAAHSVKFSLLEQKSAKLNDLMMTIAQYFDGLTSDEEFYNALNDDVLEWQEALAERKRKADVARFKAHVRDMDA